MNYIIHAAPREGKTYVATFWAIQELMKKRPKNVFSNYPIIVSIPLPITQRLYNLGIKIYNKVFHKTTELITNKIISSNVWKKEYIYSGLANAVIFIDEAYRDFSSKESMKFDKDELTFFSTSGHSDNDIYVITQSPARVEVSIRDVTNIYYYVHKWINPITQKPLWFDVDAYIDETSWKMRNMKEGMRYSRQRVRFKSIVFNSYDTKQFRNDKEQETIKWQNVDIKEYFEITQKENNKTSDYRQKQEETGQFKFKSGKNI